MDSERIKVDDRTLRSAWLLLRSGQTSAAVDMLREICTGDLGSPPARALLGRALLIRIAELSDEAKLAFGSAATGDYSSDPEQLIIIGTGLARLGEHEQALKVFHKWIGLFGEDAGVFNCIGLSQGGLGNFEEQLTAYQRALALQPDNPNWYLNVGGALASLWRLEEAEDIYRRGLLLDPDDEAINENLASVLEQINWRNAHESCSTITSDGFPWEADDNPS